MILFADEALIEVRSGKGGNGCIAFRREKYVPNGGPNGGDGGIGGDVVFCVKRNLRTLSHLRYKQVFKAKNGGDGQGSKKFGKDGEDVIIPVPPGTTIRDSVTGELLYEFTVEAEEDRYVFLHGGKGGWGNYHFKSSMNQAPRYAHDGKEGEIRTLKIELSIMADIGLVGFPNAGKSSLLDFFTNARPKIAPYPFTTKIPNLGVLRADDDRDIIIADIPGIIEGASEGAGLGIRFLKHISRTAGLAFIVDCADENYLTAFDTLLAELESFSADLVQKSRIILLNKIDVEGAASNAAELSAILHKKYPNDIVIPMSIASGEGLDKVKKEMLHLVEVMEEQFSVSGNNTGSASYVNYLRKTQTSDFLSTRAQCSDETEQYPGLEG